MIEDCFFYYLCFNKACFQQRLETDFYKVLILSGTKFSIESLVKVLSSKYALHNVDIAHGCSKIV